MQPRFIAAAWFLLLASSTVFSQGLVMDTAIYDHLPRQPMYGDGGKSESTALEGIFKIDLKPYCPKPQSQGSWGSCTAWAAGYGAMTICFAIEAKLANQLKIITDTAFSALFLYNQVRENFNDCGQGSYIHKALDVLKTTGNVNSKQFDMGNNCKKKPNNEELEVAGKHKIKDWLTLFESNSSNRVRIEKTKLSLADNKPVIIAMRTRNNFGEVGPSDKFWLHTIGDTSLSFFHAMVVIGFDDGKGAFEVMNSWGENWGNKGFFWLRYEDYARHVPAAYQIMLFPGGSPQTKVPKSDTMSFLSAKITVRVPTEIYNDEVQFKEAQFSMKNGVYELAENAWTIGKRYQLLASNITNGAYLYAFSLDNSNQIKVHWPRDATLDDKFEGMKESAVITNSFVKLVIPGPQRALILDTKGTEYICLLVSKNPLSNINEIIQVFKTNKTLTVRNRLLKATGKTLVESTKIKYDAVNIAFSCSENTTGSIVPIFIKIPVE